MRSPRARAGVSRRARPARSPSTRAISSNWRSRPRPNPRNRIGNPPARASTSLRFGRRRRRMGIHLPRVDGQDRRNRARGADADDSLFKARARVSVADAKATVLAAHPGTIAELEYEIEANGAATYEFDVTPHHRQRATQSGSRRLDRENRRVASRALSDRQRTVRGAQRSATPIGHS